MFTLSTPQSRQAGTRQRPRAKCHWHFNVLMKMRAKRKARAAKKKRTNKNMLKILWNCYKNSQQSPSESSPPSPTSSSSTSSSSSPSPLTRATNSLWQGAVFNFYTLLKAAQGLAVFMSCYDFILQHFGLRLLSLLLLLLHHSAASFFLVSCLQSIMSKLSILNENCRALP